MGDGAGALAFWLATGGIVIALLTGPIGSAFARWIEAKANRAHPREDTEAAAANREQLEQLASRVNELEERVDFAERVLSQRREAERISRGTD